MSLNYLGIIARKNNYNYNFTFLLRLIVGIRSVSNIHTFPYSVFLFILKGRFPGLKKADYSRKVLITIFDLESNV